MRFTPRERARIRKTIRNDCVARRVCSELRHVLRQPQARNNAQHYPMAKKLVAIYEDEMIKKFMKIARKEGSKSKCARRGVGAVIAKEDEVLGRGYNGVPYDLVRCTNEAPCFKINNNVKSGSPVDKQYCRAMHAEQFAIIDAAKRGKSPVGSTIFVTHQPCLECALLLIAADIVEVYFEEPYPDEFAQELLRKAGIEVHHLRHD